MHWCVPVLLFSAGFLSLLELLKVWIALGKAYLDDQCCCVLLAIHPWLVPHCYMGSHSACWEEFSSSWHHEEIGIAARQEMCSEWLWVPAEKHRRAFYSILTEFICNLTLRPPCGMTKETWHGMNMEY